MLKIKTLCNILLLLFVILCLSGCWDRDELEDNAYIIGLGIDPSEDKDKIKVTMLIANPEVGSMQGGGGSTEKPREIITFDVNDFVTAKASANSIISRDINYELLKIILISEDFAKDPRFFETITTALKDKEIRMDSYLGVTKEKTHQYFVNNHPKLETRPHKYFQFMIDHGIANGLIPDSNLFRFYKTITRETDLSLLMYTTTESQKTPEIKDEADYIAGQLNVSGELDKTQFIGAAVFKNGVMVATLTGKETRIINVLDDTTNIEDILINIPNPFSKKTEKMAIRMLKTAQNKVEMDLKGSIPKIMITIPLQIELMSNPSMVSFSKESNKKILKEHITHYLSNEVEEFLKKSQTEFKGVPYPLSTYARKYFSTIGEFQKYNWSKAYPEADIHVNADVTIVDYGKVEKKLKN